MKKINKRLVINSLVILTGILIAVFCGYFLPSLVKAENKVAVDLQMDVGGEKSILEQKTTGVLTQPQNIKKIYYQNNLVGVVNNQEILSETLKSVYNAKYKADFPDTSIGLGEDVYVVDMSSYYEYENIDDQLMNYLKDNNLFSVVTNKIEFSNGAVIYVKDIDMFTMARETYLLNFIDEDTYKQLKANKKIASLSTYGEQDVSLTVLETMTVSEGLAPEEKIYTTPEEIINFLSYGYDTKDKEYYTCKDGDTVQGVASQAGQNLTAQQLITLNPGVLVSEEQVLSPGTQVNITYFDSPINVVVTKERLAQENVYPASTKYIYDPSMMMGETIVVTKEVIGKKNVRYEDTYTNGILTSGKEVSSITTVQPVQKVVRAGTGGGANVPYNSGSGQFWYPVKNPIITCSWYCYAGHAAVDFQNRYNHWDYVYAADSGTVTRVAYDSIGGNYVIISHGNNFFTYYGHMRTRAFVNVGDSVEQGQPIGPIGMTGVATGPHVHFEVRIGTTRVNPCNYLGC